MGYGNENQGYAIPIPVIQNLIEAGAIERIGEYAVAAHEAKIKFPWIIALGFAPQKIRIKRIFIEKMLPRKVK